jgi:uncharacterized membrane protein
MNLTLLGVILIVLGMIILMLIPFIPLQVGGTLPNVSGLTCIVVFFIPICFSVGLQPTIATVFAVVIALILALFTFIIYKVFKSLVSSTGF